MSIISCTSPNPSARILPISRVTSAPRSALCCRNSSPIWRTISPRFGAGVMRQPSNSSSARFTTRSYSRGPADWTFAISEPSAGLMESSSRPEGTGIHSPPHAPELIGSISRPSRISSTFPAFVSATFMRLPPPAIRMRAFPFQTGGLRARPGPAFFRPSLPETPAHAI